MSEKKYYTKEPIIHSNISDKLPEDHPLAYVSIYCDNCKLMIHAFNNECMETWIETEFGNYCTQCFELKPVLEEHDLEASE